MPTNVLDRPKMPAPRLDPPDIAETVEVPAVFTEAFRVSDTPARDRRATGGTWGVPGWVTGICGAICSWVCARVSRVAGFSWPALVALGLLTAFLPSLFAVRSDAAHLLSSAVFTPYQGASSEPLRFVIKRGRTEVAAVPGALLLDWQEGREAAVRMQFGNAAAEPEVERQVDGTAGAASIRYREAWPGIDAVIRSTPTGLAYDFIVAPGVDPATIELTYAGATELLVEPEGHMRVKTAGGGWLEGRPESWQDGPAGREGVHSAFDLRGNDRFGFTVGPYDPSRPLVVDPPMELID